MGLCGNFTQLSIGLKDWVDLVENTKLTSSGFTVLKISQIRVKNFHMQIIFVYAQTFVSPMNSKWELCTGTWSAWDQTQIIGSFWYRFWLGDHIVLALPKNCMRSTEERGNKRRSLVHFCVVSDLVSTLCWRLQKTTRGQLKCARMNVDHWSILMSFPSWCANCDDFWQLNIVP